MKSQGEKIDLNRRHGSDKITATFPKQRYESLVNRQIDHHHQAFPFVKIASTHFIIQFSIFELKKLFQHNF